MAKPLEPLTSNPGGVNFAIAAINGFNLFMATWVLQNNMTLERAVHLQLIASSLGPLHPIPQPLLAGIHSVKYQAAFAGEYWDAWLRELRRSSRAFGMPGERE